MKISAVILTRSNLNEKLLKKAIDSVSWCDEVVKVNTENIDGSFSQWRNEGAKKAKGDWIFYLDSDEEVTSDLKKEIEDIIKNDTKFTAFAIPRRNYIFGKEFKHTGQYPDYQKRIFLRSKFNKWQGLVHEEPIFEGSLGHLKNPILHHKDISISQMIDKTNEWSELEAKLLFESGHPRMNGFRFVSVAAREFFLRMIVQMAFLDGKEGIIYAIYQVYSRLITYSKLWEMQIKNNKI